MSQLHLAMRHLKLEGHIAYDYKDCIANHEHNRHYDIGEGAYTLTTSNFEWPNNVSYLEMLRVRKSVFWGMRN